MLLVGQNPLFHEEDETMQLYDERYGLMVQRERFFGSIMRSMTTLFQAWGSLAGRRGSARGGMGLSEAPRGSERRAGRATSANVFKVHSSRGI